MLQTLYIPQVTGFVIFEFFSQWIENKSLEREIRPLHQHMRLVATSHFTLTTHRPSTAIHSCGVQSRCASRLTSARSRCPASQWHHAVWLTHRAAPAFHSHSNCDTRLWLETCARRSNDYYVSNMCSSNVSIGWPYFKDDFFHRIESGPLIPLPHTLHKLLVQYYHDFGCDVYTKHDVDCQFRDLSPNCPQLMSCVSVAHEVWWTK